MDSVKSSLKKRMNAMIKMQKLSSAMNGKVKVSLGQGRNFSQTAKLDKSFTSALEGSPVDFNLNDSPRSIKLSNRSAVKAKRNSIMVSPTQFSKLSKKSPTKSKFGDDASSISKFGGTKKGGKSVLLSDIGILESIKQVPLPQPEEETWPEDKQALIVK